MLQALRGGRKLCDLDREQLELIERAVADGRLRRPEDAVREALALWIERERRRDEILAAIDDAERSLLSEDAIPVTEKSLRELAEDVKRRGRARAVGSE
jgi:Arc/MetJ-type ribon-helix-helix transcriptional regulator